MNHLKQLDSLKNHYFAMRHGQSVANREGIIVSDPANGVDNYGLTEEGRNQVKRSLSGNTLLSSGVRIISSDFKRARETAELVCSLLACSKGVSLDPRLRERNFGDFELTSNENYQIVWENDGRDGSHTLDNAESAEAVMQRATELVSSLEEKHENEMILLVAHGDTLQIMQAAFKKQAASKQRELEHLQTAEIRRLVISKSSV